METGEGNQRGKKRELEKSAKPTKEQKEKEVEFNVQEYSGY